MFKALFNDIETKITNIVNLNNIEWYIDQESREGIINVSPCTVLIKFAPVKRKAINRHKEERRFRFEIMIYTDYKKDNKKIKNHDLHLDIEQEIIDKLYWYDSTDQEPFKKVKSLTRTILTFEKTVICDKARMPTTKTLKENIEVKINLSFPG